MLKVFFKQLKKIIYNSSYNLISLGSSCYPKTLLTRWKLKKTKASGELTLPFDLAWFHKAEYITEFIKNDFSGFFQDLRYMKEIGSWDNYGKINFSHETSFGADDKDKLVNLYEIRINNFRKLIQDEKPILFLQFLKVKEVGEDVSNLYSTLKQIRGDKPFELLVVDTNDIVQECSSAVNVLKIVLPFQDPNLYDANFYKSKEGVQFEKQIVDKLTTLLENNLGCKLYKYL